MRILVTLLALLAAGKLATLQWIHRTASDDVIVNAYRPRALDACGRDARRAFGLDAAAWNVDTPIRLEMGRRSANVYFWQVDDPAWSERYRNPYLHLTVVAAGTQVSCAYDVVRGIAAASRT